MAISLGCTELFGIKNLRAIWLKPAKSEPPTPVPVSFRLTASGPAIPGKVVQFNLTVTNLTNAFQCLTATYHVPQFTTATSGGYPAGTVLGYTFGNVAAKTSQTATFSLQYSVAR